MAHDEVLTQQHSCSRAGDMCIHGAKSPVSAGLMLETEHP